MSYINVGAVYLATGARVPTKKELKRILADAPDSVGFDSTEFLTATTGQTFSSANLPPAGAKLQITGPDPYESRRWYATVERTASGWKIS
jgi:hypothetical protein